MRRALVHLVSFILWPGVVSRDKLATWMMWIRMGGPCETPPKSELQMTFWIWGVNVFGKSRCLLDQRAIYRLRIGGPCLGTSYSETRVVYTHVIIYIEYVCFLHFCLDHLIDIPFLGILGASLKHSKQPYLILYICWIARLFVGLCGVKKICPDIPRG